MPKRGGALKLSKNMKKVLMAVLAVVAVVLVVLLVKHLRDKEDFYEETEKAPTQKKIEEQKPPLIKRKRKCKKCILENDAEVKKDFKEIKKKFFLDLEKPDKCVDDCLESMTKCKKCILNIDKDEGGYVRQNLENKKNIFFSKVEIPENCTDECPE